jgi:hypothetical protein
MIVTERRTRTHDLVGRFRFESTMVRAYSYFYFTLRAT